MTNAVEPLQPVWNRIWSTDWWTNRNQAVDQLLEDVRRAQTAADETWHASVPT